MNSLTNQHAHFIKLHYMEAIGLRVTTINGLHIFCHTEQMKREKES